MRSISSSDKRPVTLVTTILFDLSAADVDDAVRVDVEGDLNLRDTTGHRRDTGELELAEDIVDLRARVLTLVELDEDTGLVVVVCREDLGLLRRDRRIALDERRHDTTTIVSCPSAALPTVAGR